jgi:hypothetical protein
LRRADVPEGCLNVSAADPRKRFASRPSDGQDGQAIAGLAAQGLDVQTGDGLDSGAARSIEISKVDEVVGQGSPLVASPGGESCKERSLVDQAVLQGEQTKEETAIAIDG